MLSRLLLQASRNHCDCFCDLRVVHRVCSFEHTALSRSRLRVRGRHRDRSGDSRKRKNIAVAFRELCGLIAIAVTICKSHRGCLLRSHGIVVIAFAIRSSFIVAAFASTRHHRNRVCDLRNHLRLLLVTRGIHRDRFSARSRTHRDHSCKVEGKKESMALKHLGGRGGWRRVLRDFLRVILVEPWDLKTEDWSPRQRS